jgi:hypothetical protein
MTAKGSGQSASHHPAVGISVPSKKAFERSVISEASPELYGVAPRARCIMTALRPAAAEARG